MQVVAPVLDIAREDLVYDAKWAPHKPSVFACVTGAGDLEVFDLNFDIEVPIARASPARGKRGTPLARGLNKCAWEERKGALIATGGLDSVVSVFEVGRGLSGGAGEANPEEWMGVRRLVGKMAKGPS
jgi:dynein intermediate chain